MRDMIASVVKPGEKPYDKQGESEVFRAWTVQPAQVASELRVQRKCPSAEPKPPTPKKQAN